MFANRTDRADNEVFLTTVKREFFRDITRALLEHDATARRRAIVDAFKRAWRGSRAFHNPFVAGWNLAELRDNTKRLLWIERGAA